MKQHMYTQHQLLQLYVRQLLLSESSSPIRDLAVVLKDRGDKKAAAFYDAGLFLSLMKGARQWEQLDDAIEKSMAAFVSIKEPYKYPCSGAWSISLAWGPGYGEVLYGTAYVLSPNHTLIPDRHSVSGRAAEAWKKAFAKSGIIKKPIDNVEDHREGMPHSEKRKNYLNRLGFEDHTDDPADDCNLYDPATTSDPEKFEHLNFYYDASPVIGRYSQTLQTMQQRNDEVMEELTSVSEEEFVSGNLKSPFDRETLEEEIYDKTHDRAIDGIERAL